MAKRLFIPGTGGCYFVTPSGKRVGSILDLALDEQRGFVCEHAPDVTQLLPTRTSAVTLPDGSCETLLAGGPIRAVYKPFFEATVPLSTTKLYTFFDYDWRLDIRHSGHRLSQFLENSGETWDIVCHSQGGLVLAWASLLLGRAKFARLVRRVVMMGVPLQGTVNAVAGLLQGVELLGDHVAADPATVRSWPAVYQMMPRWTVRVPGMAGVELFKTSTWRAHGKLGQPGRTQAGVDPSLLARARAFRIELERHAFDSLLAVDKLVLVMGHNQNTRARMPKFPALPSDARRDGDVIVRGDGLVPVDLTFKLLPSSLKDRVDSILSPVRSHMLMCSELAKFFQCESVFQTQ